MLFELVDVLVAPFPHGTPVAGGELLPFEPFRVDPHNQNLLVMRTVEDADSPARRQVLAIPPKEVVIEFVGGGLLEARDLAALGVHTAHHVLDYAVFAG